MPSVEPMPMDAAAVVFDISSVDDTDLSLQACLQLVCWSYGSSAVSTVKYLADAGLAPQRIYVLILDSCVCVSQILETDGPVLTTSNKRDSVDLTLGPRPEIGAVWVNDLQALIGEEPTWCWNPLSYVTDVSRADQLAALRRRQPRHRH